MPKAKALAELAKSQIALIVCVLFLAVGILILDDYGVSWDTNTQHTIGQQNLDYILGKSHAIPKGVDRDIGFERFYGGVFELPLVLAERSLGLGDWRDILLSRHLLTHASFLAGGLFCFLLVHRLFGSRALALFALLLFLLHPRLYGHSFFNSKDVPFASIFMIALWLTHRAFDRRSIRAFLLCGLSVAVLVNLRIFGLLLFAAVLAMRGLDWLLASTARERRQILATAGAFVLASCGALYALSPYLHQNPLEIFRLISAASQHHTNDIQLFQGKYLTPSNLPLHYIPTWLAISTPLVGLLLGLTGVGAVLHRVARRPGEALRDGRLRFGLLLIGCVALPMALVSALGFKTYNGWRHLYFLHAPLVLLAALGLHWLASISKTSSIPFPAFFGLAGLGLAAVATQMAQLHPYEHLYFNGLVNRHALGRLGSEYVMDYWGTPYREGLEYLLKRHPSSPIHILDADALAHLERNLLILPEQQRRQFKREGRVDYYVTNHHEHVRTGHAQTLFPPVIHSRKLYGNVILSVAAADLDQVDGPVADGYRAIYRQTASGTPIIRSGFDVHRVGGRLIYLKEPCRPGDLRARLRLDILPAEPEDLPAHLRPRGFRFGPVLRGVRFDGKCLASAALPDYPVAAIRTGQCDGPPKACRLVWERFHSFANPDALNKIRKLRQGNRQPAIRSDFDVFLDRDAPWGGRQLIYAKRGCSREEYERRFFLHLVPANPDDLPDERRSNGFVNLDFPIRRHGGRMGEECLAFVPLPDYGIASIRTGQVDDSKGEIWGGLMQLPEHVEALRAAYEAIVSGQPEESAPPAAHGAEARSEFDVQLDAGALSYFKAPCTAADTEAMFFLHVFPQDENDLPERRRQHGFDNLDFRFGQRGALFDGKCMARAPLPGYAIARIRTGQYTDAGMAWAAEIRRLP